MSYTRGMKIAVSIPDAVFAKAEALARQLSVSRSQLYARAVVGLLAEHDRDEITRQLDAIYTRVPSRLDAGIAALQRATLRRGRRADR